MEEIVEKIRARLAAVDPDGPRKVLGVFQFNIKNEDGSIKQITLDLHKLQLLDDNIHDSPDVTADFDAATFVALGKHETSFSDVVSDGKVKVTGDLELVKTLEEVVRKLIKKD